jgi:3-hydroxyacyl-CoA dehydrogenase
VNLWLTIYPVVRRPDMKIEDIHCVLIIGAGTMGQQIGLQCAMHAYDVILYDIVPRSTSIRQRPN